MLNHFSHVPITAVASMPNSETFLAGMGSDVIVLTSGSKIMRIKNVLPFGAPVHVIKTDTRIIAIAGQNNLAFMKIGDFRVYKTLATDEWILDIYLDSNNDTFTVVEMNSTITIFDAALKKVKSVQPFNHVNMLYAARFFSTNDRSVKLASAVTLKGLQVWADNEYLFQSDEDPLIYDIDVHHSGCYIATAGADRSVKLWTIVARWEAISSKYGHESRVWKVAFSPELPRLASCGEDCVVCVWSTENDELSLSMRLEVHGSSGRFEQCVWCICWASESVIIGCSDGKALKLEVANNKTFSGTWNSIESIVQPRHCAIVNRREVLVMMKDGSLNVTSGLIEYTKIREPSIEFCSCAFHVRLDDETNIFVSVKGYYLYVYASQDGAFKIHASQLSMKRIANIRLCSKDWILCQDEDKTKMTVFKLKEEHIIKRLDVDFRFKRQITCAHVVILSGKPIFLVGCYDGYVLSVNEYRIPERVSTKFGHTLAVNCLFSLENSNQVFSGGDDGMICEYHVTNNEPYVQLIRYVHVINRCRIERFLAADKLACFLSNKLQILDNFSSNTFSYIVTGSHLMGSSKRSYDIFVQKDEALVTYIREKKLHIGRFGLTRVKCLLHGF
ncbi:hypothetical protein ACOME3_007276 [Neoechinorhynchus agilis]